MAVAEYCDGGRGIGGYGVVDVVADGGCGGGGVGVGVRCLGGWLYCYWHLWRCH